MVKKDLRFGFDMPGNVSDGVSLVRLSTDLYVLGVTNQGST